LRDIGVKEGKKEKGFHKNSGEKMYGRVSNPEMKKKTAEKKKKRPVGNGGINWHWNFGFSKFRGFARGNEIKGDDYRGEPIRQPIKKKGRNDRLWD